MILSKIYAEGGGFHDISFTNGVNVVIGTCTRKGDSDADPHNLGKTLLLDVIDFGLLGNASKGHTFVDRIDFFKDYIFYLEIKLNDGSYVTVKRGVATKARASFYVSNEPVDGREIDGWTHSNISLTVQNTENARDLLKRLLNLNSIKDVSLRGLLRYSMRRQDEYSDTFNIMNMDSEAAWKPDLLLFVGLDGGLLKQKLSLDADIKAMQTANKILKKTDMYKSSEKDNARVKLASLKEKKKRIERSIGDVSFFEEDESISRSVVNNCDTQISQKNIQRYKLQFDIEKLSKKTETEFIDIDEIEKIYQEAQLVIPAQLTKSYEELVEFNRLIWADRQDFISSKLEEMKQRLRDIDGELLRLDEQRQEYLNRLKQQDVVQRYKRRRLEVNQIEAEIDTVQDLLSAIIDADTMKHQNEVLKQRRCDDIQKLKEMGVVSTPEYGEFVKVFHELTKDILGRTVRLIYTVNDNGNVHFDTKFPDAKGDELLLDRGASYKRLLSICFDIALAIKHSTRNHISFVAHDGVWDTLADNLKERHLRDLRELSVLYGCQFILTMLSDDIPSEYHKDDFFLDGEIVLDLDDRDDNSGRLFKALF